ncbi:MAG: universal stress protein [Ignavibacteriales bacterium]
MSWARIMVPLAGGKGDAEVLALARLVAEPFGAELAAVHAPADIADLMPWMGEGFMGGVQISAMESLKEAAIEGAKTARDACLAAGYPRTQFTTLQSPVWQGLAMESRLSDVVVFGQEPACGRGPLSEAFQQIVADEQRPVIVAREGLNLHGIMAVAWDGGKEATRAVRTALPMLQKASRVVVFGAPAASSREFDLRRIQEFLSARGVEADIEEVQGERDAGHLLLNEARELGAAVLVAGAFGHARLQEYVFGGTTRTLLNSDGPSLFLSH